MNFEEYFATPIFEKSIFSDLPEGICGGYLVTKIGNREVKTFVYVGIPKKTENCPAVVLVHGAGGNAYYQWVEEWVKRGFAAIAVDLGGFHFTENDILHRKENPSAQCYSIGGFAQILGEVRDSWIFYAVAQIIAAHSFLHSMDVVDREKTGVVGISWGGVVSLIALGCDFRFGAGAIIYSSGFITEDLLGKETGLFSDYKKKEFYDRYFDPQSYVSGIKVPVLMQAGLDDAAFSPINRQRTYQLFDYPATKAVIPALYHDNESNFQNKNVFAFMSDCLLKTKLRISLDVIKNGNSLSLICDGEVERAELLLTDGMGDPHRFVWECVEITCKDRAAKIDLPRTGKYKYAMVTVYYGDGLYTSSDIFEM